MSIKPFIQNYINNVIDKYDIKNLINFNSIKEMKENGHYQDLIDHTLHPLMKKQLSFSEIKTIVNNLYNDRQLDLISDYEEKEKIINSFEENSIKINALINKFDNYLIQGLSPEIKNNFNVKYELEKSEIDISTSFNRLCAISFDTNSCLSSHFTIKIPTYRIFFTIYNINMDVSCTEPEKRFIVPLQNNITFELMFSPRITANLGSEKCISLYWYYLLSQDTEKIDKIHSLSDIFHDMKYFLRLKLKYEETNLNPRFKNRFSTYRGIQSSYTHPFLSGGNSACFEEYEDSLISAYRNFDLDKIAIILSNWSTIYTHQSSPHYSITNFIVGSPKNFKRENYNMPLPELTKEICLKCYQNILDKSICEKIDCIFKDKYIKIKEKMIEEINKQIKKWDKNSEEFNYNDNQIRIRLDTYLIHRFLISIGLKNGLFNENFFSSSLVIKDLELMEKFKFFSELFSKPNIPNISSEEEELELKTAIIHLSDNSLALLIGAIVEQNPDIKSSRELVNNYKNEYNIVANDRELYWIIFADHKSI